MAALVIVVLAGCGSDATPTAVSVDVSTTPTAPETAATLPPVVAEPTATAASVAPTETEGATPDPAASPSPSPSPGPTPVAADDDFPGWLRVNGFGPVDLGSDLVAAQALIAPRFGAPDEIFDNPDCGLTIANWDDFSIAFEAGQLVGWFYHASTPPLESPSGVAPGITTADLRVIYQGVDISETTLGTEFFFEVPAGFIGGFFTPDGQQVTDMYAGHNCFFR